MTVTEILIKIDYLESLITKSKLPTLGLLRASNELRLDWGFERGYTFKDEYNEGATQAILVKGLSAESHAINSKRLGSSNNRIILSLAEGFISNNLLTSEKLDEIHTLIIENGGIYRTIDVAPTGGNKQNDLFSKPAEIHSETSNLITWYNTKKNDPEYHPLFLAAEFHYRLVKIHPYADGNGRLARIISSMIFLKSKIPPPIFLKEERHLYITRLKQADTGNLEGWLQLIGERVIRSQEILLKAIH